MDTSTVTEEEFCADIVQIIKDNPDVRNPVRDCDGEYRCVYDDDDGHNCLIGKYLADKEIELPEDHEDSAALNVFWTLQFNHTVASLADTFQQMADEGSRTGEHKTWGEILPEIEQYIESRQTGVWPTIGGTNGY